MSLTTDDKQTIRTLIKEEIQDMREELSMQGIVAEEARVEVRKMLGMLSENLKV